MIVSLGLPLLYQQRAVQHGLPGRRWPDRWASSPSRTWPATAFTTSRAGSSPGPAGGARELRRRRRRRIRSATCYFDCGGVQIGFEICEDAWVANRPGSDLALRRRRPDPEPQRQPLRLRQASRSASGSCSKARGRSASSYVYANLLGNEAGRAIYDGDALIASAGKLLAAGPRFSFADWHVTTAVIDVDATRMSQARTGSFRPTIEPDDRRRASARRSTFRAAAAASDARASMPAWETGPHVKEEEFARADAAGAVRLPAQEPLARASSSRSAAAPIRRPCRCLVALTGASSASPSWAATGFLKKLGYIQRLRQADDGRTRSCASC